MDILKSLGHPEEIINLFKFKMGGCRAVMPKLDYVSKHFGSVFTGNYLSCVNLTQHPPVGGMHGCDRLVL